MLTESNSAWFFKAEVAKCHLVPVFCFLRKDNKCGINAEPMRWKCMQCCCSTPPDVFLAVAVPQLCAAPWCWEAGEGCLVTKCLVCSLFSGFWPSLNTLLWRERRWIGALRLSTQRIEYTLMDIKCLFHFLFLLAFFCAFFELFYLSLHLVLLPSVSCLESNGVFEVNSRFAERF